MIRLDKYLANAGLGTRSEVKKWIKDGLVTVDGNAAKGPEQKIEQSFAAVCFRGEPVNYRACSYFVFHKPAGCVTARTDPKERTVMDFFPEPFREKLSPVGRLDKDTEGLLLVTDDGALNHRLTSPARRIEKTYYAALDAAVPADTAARFAQGIDIGDAKPTKPAVLKVLQEPPANEAHSDAAAYVLLTITEGRYHQVKRMFEAVGCRVTYLKRISFGPLALHNLERGTYRSLDEAEVARLKSGADSCD